WRRLLRGHALARAPKGARDRVAVGRRCSAPLPRREFRRRHRGLRDPQPRRPRGRPAGARPRPQARRKDRLPRDHPSTGNPAPVLPPLVRRACPGGRESPAGWSRRLLLSSGERTPLPRPRGSRCGDAPRGLRRSRLAPSRRRYRGAPRGDKGVTALETIREAPGLDRYLELLEERLEETVAAYPGLLGEIGADTLAAGGKRLRPLLVFLSTPRAEREGQRAVAGGAAVALGHMETLGHDDRPA